MKARPTFRTLRRINRSLPPQQALAEHVTLIYKPRLREYLDLNEHSLLRRLLVNVTTQHWRVGNHRAVHNNRLSCAQVLSNIPSGENPLTLC